MERPEEPHNSGPPTLQHRNGPSENPADPAEILQHLPSRTVGQRDGFGLMDLTMPRWRQKLRSLRSMDSISNEEDLKGSNPYGCHDLNVIQTMFRLSGFKRARSLRALPVSLRTRRWCWLQASGGQTQATVAPGQPSHQTAAVHTHHKSISRLLELNNVALPVIAHLPRTRGRDIIPLVVKDRPSSPRSVGDELEYPAVTTSIFGKVRSQASDCLGLPLSLSLWHNTLKEIGGSFGSGVLSYFLHLRWLLLFNALALCLNIIFLLIPQLLHPPEHERVKPFPILELFTGTGYFSNTPLFYGFYTNTTINLVLRNSHNEFGNVSSNDGVHAGYSMQLAYLFTISAYLFISSIILLVCMARSFSDNYVKVGTAGTFSLKVFTRWDFNLMSRPAVLLEQRNIATSLKEMLSESRTKEHSPWVDFVNKLTVQPAIWLIYLGTALGCCSAIFFLYEKSEKLESQDDKAWKSEAGLLVLPTIISFFNMVLPLLYSRLAGLEGYRSPVNRVYVTLVRNIILKMFIIAGLFYHWLQKLSVEPNQCWETTMGQQLYRLVVMDFLFLIFDTVLIEYIFGLVTGGCQQSYAQRDSQKSEFDIARNVLDLIYGQTLVWLGAFFSPLLPAVQLIKLLLLFYIKKESLFRNCQQPAIPWMARKMSTVFVSLQFFPAFFGAVAVVFILWRQQPSKSCGPFRGLQVPSDAIDVWTTTASPKFSAVIWILNNIIENPIFLLVCTGLIIIGIYANWQIVHGYRQIMALLQNRIEEERMDKNFLLERLKMAQGTGTRAGNQHKIG
uniref:transmembrane channel-like protein 6 isoform X1 n=1 Tax=Myxine glutinosa TaxID=7769 RepID=UPI00358F9172